MPANSTSGLWAGQARAAGLAALASEFIASLTRHKIMRHPHLIATLAVVIGNRRPAMDGR